MSLPGPLLEALLPHCPHSRLLCSMLATPPNSSNRSFCCSIRQHVDLQVLFRILTFVVQMQERQVLSSKQADAQRAASAFLARQHELEAQLGSCADRTSSLQKSVDSTSVELTANQQKSATLQVQLTKLQHQHEHTAASLSAAASKLKELEQLPPKLSQVSKEADVCRREMSTLTGSQAKVHESLQAYLRQEKELRRDLHVAEQHLSHVSQDYAVCQDTSAHLRFHVRQTKVGLLLKKSQGLSMILFDHTPHPLSCMTFCYIFCW